MFSRAPRSSQLLIAIADADARRRAARALSSQFHAVETALADETWVHLQTETESMPRLAILSAFYPVGMTGLELIARMRADSLTRRVPALLLFLPSQAPARPCEGCRIARWDWCMAQPNDMRAIRSVVAEIVRVNRADEPFSPPNAESASGCWSWWRTLLAQHGLTYPAR
jgi:CheY-like chemotaxis protein